MSIQPLSHEQTQHLANLYHTLDVYELADAIEQFICDYGYDETDDDDMTYETTTVTYQHRAGVLADEFVKGQKVGCFTFTGIELRGDELVKLLYDDENAVPYLPESTKP